MAQEFKQDWDRGDKSALVSIGTHKLFLGISGPNREPNEPIVVLMQGLGSTIDEWVAVRPLVTPFARFLWYDRSGMGKSESPPEAVEAISAVSVANELDTLLKSANIAPPYIVVCHSWGGITSREFLHLRTTDIVGMVFVDANQEKTYVNPSKCPYPYLAAVQGKVNYLEATGIKTDHILSLSEFDTILREQELPRHQATEEAEQAGFRGDIPILAAKKQIENHSLGNRPISVIHANTARDFQRVYDAGVAMGNGSDEERVSYREFIAHWVENGGTRAKEILGLSSDSSLHRYGETIKSGHNVQLLEPELIAKEIEWVWNHAVKHIKH
jgi:pimeloyl-ACP methyl ester carboxylesterase